MRRNIWFIAIGVIIAAILINNSIYYFLARQTLEEAHHKEMLALSAQIELSVEQSRIGAELYEEGIARELRAASIAAQYALDPDVDNVTNEQLRELRDKLELSHISLLKKTEDDIVIHRSSDPGQLGKSTKSWEPWHDYFGQLFRLEPVGEDWLGQSMSHFWSGPFEVSSTELDKVYKWGYYFDGATNFITDPYVNFQRQDVYNKVTGVDRLISSLEDGRESLLEVTVMNPRTFPDGIWSTEESGEVREHFVQRPILYGQYHFKMEHDVAAVQEAYQTKKLVELEETVEGKRVHKMFVPVFITDKGISITDESGKAMDAYVISIASDYDILRDGLNSQFLNLGLIIILLTVISLAIALVVMRYYKGTREKAVGVAQQTYADEINSMFQAIRAQRHDFLNHVQTIHSLAVLNKSQELAAYTKELTGEIRLMNDIINIGNPAIAALIRSKVSQAESYRIHFHCSFSGLDVKGMGVKTLDMNRVLGNLIDNAFDEVLKLDEAERNVVLEVRQNEQFIEIDIANPCKDAQHLAKQPLFQSGFTTKKKEHQGLGLFIVKSIADRNKGTVKVEPRGDNVIAFVVTLPL
ncbi:sensor histidine kinase [Paenibacillus sp. CAU 1782]